MITTHIVGNVFVIVDPDGDLETVVSSQTTLNWVQIYTLLRGTFGDHYDFLSCYLDVGSGVVNLGAASDSIFQDATGIGRHVFNFRPSWGTTKLQAHSHYSFFSLNTLLHEIGHRWLGYVNYADMPGGLAQHLLHQDWVWTPSQDSVHWGRWLDDQNSCMDYDQAEWIDNGDGTFNRIDREPTNPAHEEWFGYSPLDQYLMGLIPATGVPNFTVVRNPSPALTESGPSGVPTGPYTPSPSALTVTIAQIQNTRSDEPVAFSGIRNPNHLNSQRVFHEAVVVITKNSSLATTFLTNSDTWRHRHTANFRRVSSGRAMIDTSLLRSNYADLYVKDNAADTGAATSGSPFWLSPDLWVRNADDGGTSHQNTIRTQSNWIHARVRNKGSQAYQDVTVHFSLANFAALLPGTEFLYPVDWNPQGLLGSASIASVPAASGGTDGTAIAKIEWTSDKIPPALGWHPCLLCEVIPMEVSPSGLHHVFENRKLAQRNITIVDPPPPPPPPMPGSGGQGGGGGYMFALRFLIGHELRRAESVQLRIAAESHFDEVHLYLDLGHLAEGLGDEAEIDIVDLPLGPGGVLDPGDAIQIIPDLTLPSRGETSLRPTRGLSGLTVFVPRGTELGIMSGPDAAPDSSTLRVRFEDDVRLQIGHARKGMFSEKYQLRGFRPILLNGSPLLKVTDPDEASLVVRPAPGRRTMLRLLGIVSPHRQRGRAALYHIIEAVGKQVLGGLSLQVNL